VKVLVADDISMLGLQKLDALPNAEVVVRVGMSESELLEEVKDADALLVRSQTQVTAAVLDAARTLRVVGRAGVGVDNIDVAHATKKGVIVVNAPDGNTIAAAEHTFALLMSVARYIPLAHRSVMAGEWKRKNFVGVELLGKTLGIIGMGRIGTEVAVRARAFKMKILGYDPFLTEERAAELGIVKTDLQTAIREADLLTVHTPLTKDTRHLISTEAFAAMKQGVRIVNCARGGIIDEAALCAALEEGKVAAAALDVFENEPLPSDSPLKKVPNLILTPHLGASTVEAQEQVAISVAEEVVHILSNEPFRNAVNLPALSAEQLTVLAPVLELGEQLGAFIGQLFRGDLSDVQITVGGEWTKQDTGFLSRTVLKGLLAQRYADEVNYVNAPTVAAEIGLVVSDVKQARSKIYTSFLSVSADVSGTRHTVVGTLYNGSHPRIVEIDNYRIDAEPYGSIIFTYHMDQPGMIGKIGSLIGEAGVNIASMQVGRTESGGEAIMLLCVDRTVPDDVVADISDVAGVRKVRMLQLS
jgi:D-3-phosphoglycerate dehydrogenase / 2-oxoglutarate reductase